MTTLSLYGGPLKRTLIQRAYSACGQDTTQYDLTPEEYERGLQCANSVAATLPTLAWNAPAHGDGSPEDESGLAADEMLGFVAMLAQEIGQGIGKDFRPNGTQARAISSLRARYTPTPFMELGRQTPRGAGNRYWGGRPYFASDVSDSEPNQ